MLADDEKQMVKQIIVFFWGNDLAHRIKPTERVAEVVYSLLADAKVCSEAMDFVPQAPGWKPDIRYIMKQLRKIIERMASSNIYFTCKQVISLKGRSQLELANMGL